MLKKLYVNCYLFDSKERQVNYILEKMEDRLKKVINILKRKFIFIKELSKALKTAFFNYNKKTKIQAELIKLY